MSYHAATAKSVDWIDKVFVLGAPESESAVTSRVGTTGGHYPSSSPGVPFPMQDFQTSLAELRGLNRHDGSRDRLPRDENGSRGREGRGHRYAGVSGSRGRGGVYSPVGFPYRDSRARYLR